MAARVTALGDAALEYAAAGLAVFPCHSPRGGGCSCGRAECKDLAKHPRTLNGLKDATCDEATIREWWRRWPDANIAIATGAISGIVALDVDVPKGGAATLAALEHEHGKLPRTAQVLTGGGGYHYIFQHPGIEIRNSAGKLGAGLDFRGDGGYMIAPPSVHVSGRAYQWMRGIEQAPPAELPTLADATERRNGHAAPVGDVIPEGQRHAELLSIAGTLRRRGLGAVEILATLEAVNRERCKPPVDAAELRALADDVADRYEPELVASLRVVEPPPMTESTRPDGPVFIDLRDIEVRDIEWLDEPFLPRGELVTNNADGDTGKGLLSVHWAARISRGEFGDPRMVVFAVAEDAYDTVLKPRLLAAGANLAHVRALGWKRAGTEDALLIPDDVHVLEQHLSEMHARLLVIDPLLSHLSGKTNTHTDHEVKIALKPLMTLAHNTRCTVLGNGHFSKDKSGGARKAASGSTAFTNTPRVGLAMAYDDEDPDVRIVEVIKSNIGPKHVGRNYRIRVVPVAGLEKPIALLVAEGAAVKAVDDLIAAHAEAGKRVPAELIQALILAELETGEKSRVLLDAAVQMKLGANPDSVYKSGLVPLKRDGRIKARKDGTTGGWFWQLTLEEQA
jgi:hypothetical protein